MPVHVKTPALTAGVAAILVGFFSYLLGLSHNGTEDWFGKFLQQTFRSVSSRMDADAALFLIAGLLFATVAVVVVVVWKHLGRAIVGTVLSGAFALYALLLLISGIAFRQIYVTMTFGRSTAMAFYRDLPIWLLVILMTACFVALIRLFGTLNTAGRVFAVLTMIGAASVVSLMLFYYFGNVSPVATVGSWFTAPSVTYVLFGCVMLSLATMRTKALDQQLAN